MYQVRRLAAAAAVILFSAAAAAQNAVAAPPANPAYTTVTGIAWDANNNPIAGARTRLRNVATTRIVAAAAANAAGKFTFDSIEAGSYVVELVDAKGKVLGVGPMFNALPGQSLATFVRLAGHARGGAALFGNTAAAIVASAAGLGITTVTATGRDISPETARTGSR
jgi:hypothetical protein